MEITKSVSLKVNIGNYQTVDFFCSAKSEGGENPEKVAQDLHQFCVKEITKDRNTSLKYLKGLADKDKRPKVVDILDEEIGE